MFCCEEGQRLVELGGKRVSRPGCSPLDVCTPGQQSPALEPGTRITQ